MLDIERPIHTNSMIKMKEKKIVFQEILVFFWFLCEFFLLDLSQAEMEKSKITQSAIIFIFFLNRRLLHSY